MITIRSKNVSHSIIVFFTALFLLSLFGCASAPPTRREKEGERPPAEEEEETGLDEKAQPEKEPEEPNLYEIIENYLEKGEIEKAVTYIKEHWTPEMREDRDFILLYGSLLLVAGDYEEAQELLIQSSRDFPGDSEIIYTHSLVEGILGNSGKERELLETVLSLDPRHDLAMNSLGMMYLDENKLNQAEKLFTEILKNDPANSTARAGLGKTMLLKKKYEEALRHFTKVLKENPDSPLVYSDRSRAYLGLDEFRLAEKDLNRAVSLEPENFWHHLDRGKVRLYLGKTDEALEDFNRAITLEPDNFFPYTYRGELYFRKGQPREALQDYQKVLSQRKDYYPAFPPMGALMYMQDRWSSAAAYFKRAYETSSSDETLALLSALSYVRGGENKKAEAVLSEVIKNAKRDGPLHYVSRFLLDQQFETRAFRAIDKEENDLLKYRYMFILGALSVHHGQPRVAAVFFHDVVENLSEDSIEFILAKHEQKNLEKGD